MIILVVFDVDNVLSRGLIIVNFAEYLCQKSSFDKVVWEEMAKAYSQYKTGQIDYLDAGRKAIDFFAAGVKGQEAEKIEEHAKDFVNNALHFFDYSKNLVLLLKGFKIISLSASPSITIKILSTQLGFNDFFATEFEIIDGKYTGRSIRSLLEPGVKKKILLNYASANNLDLTQAIGFGDTECDVEFLEELGHPIAINPSDRLRKTASERGWLILTEKDDVVGEVKKIIEAKT